MVQLFVTIPEYSIQRRNHIAIKIYKDGTPFTRTIERVSVDTPKNVLTAKKAVQKAFQNQIDGSGFSLVEVLSLCPTDWGMTPLQALDWVRDHMMKYYPLGVYKDAGRGTRDESTTQEAH